MADQAVDYAALAEQARKAGGGVDYAALAAKARGEVPVGDTMRARMSPHEISDAPDSPPSRVDNLNAALEPLAHPKTAGDFAGLLVPSGVGAVATKMFAPVSEAISRYGGAAAKVAGAAATTMLPPAMVTPIRGALRVLGELKPSEWNSPLTVAGREARAHNAVAGMVERYKPNISGAIDAGIPQGELPQSTASMVDRYKPNVGSIPDSGVPQGPLPQSTASMVDRYHPNTSGVPDRGIPQGELPQSTAAMVDRYHPNTSSVPDRGVPQGDMPTHVQIDRYMPNSGGMSTSGGGAQTSRIPYAPATEAPQAAGAAASTSTAPLTDLELARKEVAAGRLPPSALAAIERAQQAAPKTPPGMIRGTLKPITVAPESPMQPPSPLQQPRVNVGAEVVGRQNGLTKEAVRQQTGPLFNEAPGAASPVVPQTPFDRMHDKLLQMGHGSPAREAYVQAAKDPKTAGQLEIMRRTLERNGLVLGGMTSAEALRRAVMQRLQGNSEQ